MGPDPVIRLDKWLWAARFYKTRTLAHEAIENGRVVLNGARTKPSRSPRIGDELTITRGQLRHVVIVRGLSDAELDRSGKVLVDVPAMTAAQAIEGILINHVNEHLGSIRATTGAK